MKPVCLKSAKCLVLKFYDLLVFYSYPITVSHSKSTYYGIQVT